MSNIRASGCRDRKSVKQLIEKTLEQYGKIDILINNAGITRDATLIKMDPADFQRVLDVNLTGVFNCTQAVMPHMLANGAGKLSIHLRLAVFTGISVKPTMQRQKRQSSE